MTWLLPVLLGVAAFVFSMLGLGGALVYNPLMVWFGYPFKEVVAPTGLLLNGLTALSAAWVYTRRGLVDWRAALPLVIGASTGAPLGAGLTRFVPVEALLWMFSGAVVLAALRMLAGQREEITVQRWTAAKRAAMALLVGLGVGTLAGMLGIGGGFLFVPLLLFLGFPTKVAAATTAVAVVFSSFTGVLGHLAVGHFEAGLMVTASLAVLLGSQAGARLMVYRLNPVVIRRMFALLLLGIAVKLVAGLL